MTTGIPGVGQAGRRNRLSLELRLPLLMTLVMVGLVGAIVLAAFRQVRDSARVSAADRLESAARQLTDMLEPAVASRLEQLRAAARDPAVVAYLQSGGSKAADRALAVLQQLRADRDTTLSVQLWSQDRNPVLTVPVSWARDEELRKLALSQARILPQLGGVSPFFFSGDAAHMWIAHPVMLRGERLGWVAQLREIEVVGSSAITQLIGAHVSVHFAADPDADWMTLNGKRLPAPAAWPFTGSQIYDRPGEPSQLGYASQIPGTPWSIVTEMPMSAVLARPRAFLRRISAIAAVLVLLGTAAAWLLSRSVTRPLKQLTAALSAIAAGRYDERVAIERDDELGALAKSFNHMVAQIDAGRRDMEMQFAEAHALAMELGRTNDQLQSAMSEAEAARSDAQRASRAKSDFMATMSHEIRTPINAMIGYADLLEMEIAGPLTDRQREQLARIKASGRHLVGLVDEVLDLAGIESGRLRLQPQIAELTSAVDTAIAILRPEAFAKKLRLELVCECGDAVRYVGDPRRVEQIMVNLVSNAVKFTPAGGEVSVNCRRTHARGRQWSEVKVADTGVGIPADQLEQIFEPFVQADTGYTRSHGGVGLGLAISRRLARMMGGELSVASNAGQGSVFTLLVPAAPRERGATAVGAFADVT